MTLNNKEQNLINILLKDEKKVDRNLYSAGPYWDYKTKKILYWLNKKGLDNFRGINSGVGASYTDTIVSDIRNELGFKGRLVSLITHFPFIKKIFNEQVKLTSKYISYWINRSSKYYETNERVKYLLSKYKIEDSTEFGCQLKFKHNNKEFSKKYLEMCDRIDTINKLIDMNKIASYFEIGGGFGANIHLLINNFKNIKKVIYLDVVPNLFVGTEYLRFFFGNSVKDYISLRDKDEIKFSDNNELEIYCIPPWKIKNLFLKVDHFHNSASFQEMPVETVKNYKNYVFKLLKEKSISLIVYEGEKNNQTLNPEMINNIFENKLLIKNFPNIDDNKKKLFYLISK